MALRPILSDGLLLAWLQYRGRHQRGQVKKTNKLSLLWWINICLTKRTFHPLRVGLSYQRPQGGPDGPMDWARLSVSGPTQGQARTPTVSGQTGSNGWMPIVRPIIGRPRACRKGDFPFRSIGGRALFAWGAVWNKIHRFPAWKLVSRLLWNIFHNFLVARDWGADGQWSEKNSDTHRVSRNRWCGTLIAGISKINPAMT